MSEIIRLSPTIAKVLLEKSPAHAWQAHRLLGGGVKKSSRAMDRGKLIEHVLGLGSDPGEGRADIVTFEASSWQTKAAKEFKEAALANNQTPILLEDWTEAEAMAPTIKAKLAAKGISLEGETQVRLEWDSKDPDNPASKGVPCSGVLDLLQESHGELIVSDLKVCSDASPKFLQRQVVNMGWDLQAAAYIEALTTLRPDYAGRITFRLLAVEPFAPFAVSPIEFSGSLRELGARKWTRAVMQWGLCMAVNKFPDYSSGIVRLEPTNWQIDQDMAADLAEQDKALEASR